MRTKEDMLPIVRGIIQKMTDDLLAERDALVRMLCNCFPSYAGHDCVHVQTPYGLLYFTGGDRLLAGRIWHALPEDNQESWVTDVDEKIWILMKLRPEDFGAR